MNKIKTIIIGVGNIFNLAYKPVLPDLPLEVVALVDVNEYNLNKASQELKVKNIYSDFKLALKENEDSQLVIITAPTYLHYKFIKLALEYNKNVIVEKPLANNIEKAKAILKLAKENLKNKIFVGHTRRYDNRYSLIKEEVSKLGKVLYIHRSELGCMRYKFNNWFFDFEKSGNIILDVGVHSVDLLNWILGKLPVSIDIYAKYISKEAKKYKYYDWAKFILTYSDTITADIEVSWAHCMNFKPFHSSIEIFAEKGRIVYEDKDTNPLLIINENDIKYPLYSPLTSTQLNSFYNELMDFINCIKYNKEPIISLDEAYKTVELILSSDIKLIN